VTVTVIAIVWVMEPLVKVKLTVYVPTVVFLPAATVKTAVPVPPEDSVTLFELRLSEGLCGEVGDIEADMLMVPLNPLRLDRVRTDPAAVEFDADPL